MWYPVGKGWARGALEAWFQRMGVMGSVERKAALSYVEGEKVGLAVSGQKEAVLWSSGVGSVEFCETFREWVPMSSGVSIGVARRVDSC